MKPLRALLALFTIISCGVRAGVPTGPAAAPVSSSSIAAALADAHRLASLRADLRVLRVSGQSMHPYFGDGSVLVVQAVRAALLRPGMIAVYQNRFGETVAHRVERADGAGWVARGANNAQADSTIVTDDNLVGAVYTTFYADPGSAATLVDNSALSATPVALAAAAR
jgi:signal peptidase I